MHGFARPVVTPAANGGTADSELSTDVAERLAVGKESQGLLADSHWIHTSILGVSTDETGVPRVGFEPTLNGV